MLGYPGPGAASRGRRRGDDRGPAAAPAPDAGELSFFSTITTFGTAVDITVSELSIEAFFPADEQTADALLALATA